MMGNVENSSLPDMIERALHGDSIGDYEIYYYQTLNPFPFLLTKKGEEIGAFKSEAMVNHVARLLNAQEALQETLNPAALEILLECITDSQVTTSKSGSMLV